MPILAMLIVFQLAFRRFRKQQLLKITIGLIYTFAGLVLFLTGAEEINKEHGFHSDACGTITALPVDKAYKI